MGGPGDSGRTQGADLRARSRRRMWRLAFGSAVAALLAVGAYLVWRQLSRWDRVRPRMCLIDGERVLLERHDRDGRRSKLTMVDRTGAARWTAVVSWLPSAPPDAQVGLCDRRTGVATLGLDVGVALDDGRELWRGERELGGELTGMWAAGAVLVGETSAGELVAVDAQTGATLWRKSLPAGANAHPLGGLVAVTDARPLGALVAGTDAPQSHRTELFSPQTGASLRTLDSAACAVGEELLVFGPTGLAVLTLPELTERGRAPWPEVVSPSSALRCGSHGEHYLVAWGDKKRSRLVAVDRSRLEVRFSVEPPPGVPPAIFIGAPLVESLPRWVPFAASDAIRVVDAETGALAELPQLSKSWRGFRVREVFFRGGRAYLRDELDEQYLAVLAAEQPAIAAEVDLMPAAYFALGVSAPSVWFHDGKARIGRLDGESLEPDPGSEWVVSARRVGAP